jgi:ABC-type sugar transport system ATPase subunit
MQKVLEMRGVGKSFTGTKALDGVQLSVSRGEVVCLMGENGAGKSTLMKILSGVWQSGSFDGELWVSDPQSNELKQARFNDTRDAHKMGIAMIHQELSVFPELTVAEHLELDQLPRWVRWDELYGRTQAFLDSIHFGLRADTKVGELSVGGRQLVEIARAIYRNAQILVFDEPTSALTEQEVVRLYSIVEKLRSEGKAIVYITHRMDEVFRLADRIVVLRDGKNAGELNASRDGKRISRSELEPQLITWMVGRSITDIYPSRCSQLGDELMRVEGLSLQMQQGRYLVRDLNFVLKRGEVLGLGGLLGAGRSETFEALFGVLNGTGPRGRGYRVSGRVWIHGAEVNPSTPRDAIESKMAFVSEDRKGSGLVVGQSIRSNMTLPALAAFRDGLTQRPGLISMIREEEETSSANHWSKQLRIKAAHLDQSVGELSGGNQQKVVLAKWLMTRPDILFLDEPTRGIDIGAKVEIYQWIQRLSSEGIGIVVASSEMPELLGICHRILVLREGSLSAEFPAETVTQEDIMRAASL